MPNEKDLTRREFVAGTGYAALQLTETMLLGLVAPRAGQGKTILYDGERGQITNMAGANQYLTREYRAGWSL